MPAHRLSPAMCISKVHKPLLDAIFLHPNIVRLRYFWSAEAKNTAETKDVSSTKKEETPIETVLSRKDRKRAADLPHGETVHCDARW